MSYRIQWPFLVLLTQLIVAEIVLGEVENVNAQDVSKDTRNPMARFLFYNATSGNMKLSIRTLGMGMVGTGATMGMGALLYAFLKPFFGKKRSDPEETNYYEEYYYDTQTEQRSMNNGFNWKDLNVLDWIAMFEEMYRKYDRFNPECHQRILCEFHETSRFQGVARQLDTVADYTGVFRKLGIHLNESFQELLDNLTDAIDKGRKGENTCEYYYGSCEFSIKDMSHKYLEPVNSNDLYEQEFEDS